MARKTMAEKAEIQFARLVASSAVLPPAKKGSLLQQVYLNQLDRQFVKALNGSN